MITTLWILGYIILLVGIFNFNFWLGLALLGYIVLTACERVLSNDLHIKVNKYIDELTELKGVLNNQATTDD